MQSFQTSTWADIEALRARMAGFDSLEGGAQSFAESLATCCPTVVLARVFVVLPMARLSPEDRRFGETLVSKDARLDDRTPVLVLLGTAGKKKEWNARERSTGHRAIPLLDGAFVQNIPMIAKLLADLDVGFSSLDQGRTLDTRRLLGGKNAAFFVPDARSAEDDEGRRIIPNREFVESNAVRTVFGMGGAFVDGTLAVAVVFTSEAIDRVVVDRYPSLISNFKMATSGSLAAKKIYRPVSVERS